MRVTIQTNKFDFMDLTHFVTVGIAARPGGRWVLLGSTLAGDFGGSQILAYFGKDTTEAKEAAGKAFTALIRLRDAINSGGVVNLEDLVEPMTDKDQMEIGSGVTGEVASQYTFPKGKFDHNQMMQYTGKTFVGMSTDGDNVTLMFI